VPTVESLKANPGMQMRSAARITRLCPIIACLAGFASVAPVHAQSYEKIDCSQSRLGMTPMKTCRRGPDKDYGQGIHCVSEKYNGAMVSTTRTVWTHLSILSKNKSDGSCFITNSGYPENLKQMNKLVRDNGANWSALTKISGIEGFTFDLRKRKCFAFAKRESASNQSNSYNIQAYICGAKDGAPLNNAEIAPFAASIKVRTD
jgi:hypothetical protein